MELIIQTPGPKLPYKKMETIDKTRFSLDLFKDVQISYLT